MKDDSARDKVMDKLVAMQLRARLKPGSGNCPDAEILAAYVECTLVPRERASCETHLAHCLGCQALVAELIRLSEDDEPAGIQTAAVSAARAAPAPRFRWAWAGSALAAILVGGLWYTGEFRKVLQQTPEIQHHVQTTTGKLSAPVTEEKKTAPAASERREALDIRTQGKKSLSDKIRTGAHAANIAAPQAQNRAMNGPTAAPPAADGLSAARSSGIATLSERARLAKPGPGAVGRVGSGVGTGVMGGSIGGIASGASSNTISVEKSKGATPPAPYSASAQLSRASAKAVNVTADSMPREAQAKDESASMASTGSTLRHKEQAKQVTATNPPVNPVMEIVELQAEPATPQWRVGRRGLIERRDANGKWKKQESGVKAHLNDIAFSNPETGWAVGQSGTVLRTTDGGATWTKVPSPTAEDLVHVTAPSAQEASVVTRGGQTFETINGGKTWSSAGH
ncbi:MAG TPA: YCF48-related protein [Terriglobia bacterium]|nr:YCF48-related protein [Terriglobia bacterium]